MNWPTSSTARRRRSATNDKGFLVESRRGSGGFVRIVRLRPKQQDRTPVLLEERLPAVSITLDDLDGFLFQLIKQHRMTNREAILMHQTFDALYKEIDDEAKRLAVISRILRHLNTH